MEFLPQELTDFIESHTTPEPEHLAALNRETWAKVVMPRMLSGHLQGRVLSMLSQMIQPEKILEIGTYTGYSAICLCEGLKPNGKLITIDINDELEELVMRHVKNAGCEKKIEYRTGDATQLIPTINETFDIVFIDADKENYSNYFDLVIDKVRTGGFIIADNVLWSGNVLKPENEMDEETKAIVAFDNKVQSDNRVENVLFPIRDGLMICRKK